MSGEGVESEEEEEEEVSRVDRAEDWREKDVGRVLEEKRGAGTEGGVRRDEPLVRDWVLCHEDEEEERRSDVSVSKGSGFHCASLWNPFIPLVCAAGAVSDLVASGGRA